MPQAGVFAGADDVLDAGVDAVRGVDVGALAAPPSGDGSAADRPAVRPVRSASCRSRTRPACDTTPVPPPVTSRPRDHAVAFT